MYREIELATNKESFDNFDFSFEKVYRCAEQLMSIYSHQVFDNNYTIGLWKNFENSEKSLRFRNCLIEIAKACLKLRHERAEFIIRSIISIANKGVSPLDYSIFGLVEYKDENGFSKLKKND